MRTRLDHYIDTKTLDEKFGVSVKIDGTWRRVAKNKALVVLDTKDEAETLRAEMRAR